MPEQNTTSKKQVKKLLELESELHAEKDKRYKIVAIKDTAIHAKTAEDLLSGLYCFVFWKNYLKDENTREPASAVMYL